MPSATVRAVASDGVSSTKHFLSDKVADRCVCKYCIAQMLRDEHRGGRMAEEICHITKLITSPDRHQSRDIRILEENPILASGCVPLDEIYCMQ